MRNQKRSDVLIVGAGPAGTRSARFLSADREVTVVEEHKVSGRPVQCTGLISDDVVRLSGVNVDVLNSLYGANVHFPCGGVLTARSTERKAVLIDRSDLDVRMAGAAMDAGAEILYDTKYVKHTVAGGIVAAETSAGTFSSDILIGADGHSSTVAASLGDNGPKEYVRGIQVDIAHTMDDQEILNIYVGSETAPGFFAWVIPFGDKTRVGLCASSDMLPPAEYLKNLLRRTGLQNCRVLEKHSGKIPLGGRRITYGDNVLLIGDAAGQVKPISGGGLYPAFRSVGPLYETVSDAFSKNDMSSSVLRSYEDRWKAEVGREMRNGYRLRKRYIRVNDKDFDKAFEKMNRPDVISVLNGIDIDHPSDIARPLVKNVRVMMGLVPIALRTFFR